MSQLLSQEPKQLQSHLCSYEVMKAVHAFKILGHNDSLSPVALGRGAHMEQRVGDGGLHLDGTRRHLDIRHLEKYISAATD